MKVLSTLVLLAAPYAVAQAQAPFACNLLTAAEVQSAVGWKPGASESKTYGTTGTCTCSRPAASMRRCSSVPRSSATFPSDKESPRTLSAGGVGSTRPGGMSGSARRDAEVRGRDH